MTGVNQTRPHCLNQMGKTHSKLLAAQHGRGKAWAQHGRGMLCVNRPGICGNEKSNAHTHRLLSKANSQGVAALSADRGMWQAHLHICTALLSYQKT